MRNVLLVDDDEDLLSELRDLLLLIGFDAVPFLSPGDALKYLGLYPCVLLLADFRMPNMTGVQLAHQAVKLHPKISVIIMSASVVDQSIFPDDWHFLLKPF